MRIWLHRRSNKQMHLQTRRTQLFLLTAESLHVQLLLNWHVSPQRSPLCSSLLVSGSGGTNWLSVEMCVCFSGSISVFVTCNVPHPALKRVPITSGPVSQSLCIGPEPKMPNRRTWSWHEKTRRTFFIFHRTFLFALLCVCLISARRSSCIIYNGW